MITRSYVKLLIKEAKGIFYYYESAKSMLLALPKEAQDRQAECFVSELRDLRMEKTYELRDICKELEEERNNIMKSFWKRFFGFYAHRVLVINEMLKDINAFLQKEC